MSEYQLIAKYFEALCNCDGKLMRSIFATSGVIDDYVGRHHVGGDAIEAFINQVARRKLRILTNFIQEGHRWTVVAGIDYADGRTALVRWIFQIEDGKIAHVSNTGVQMFPDLWSRTEPLLMESA